MKLSIPSLRPRQIVALGLWVLLALLEASWLLAPPPAAWVETWYSRGVYPAVAGVLVPISDLVPFSLSFLALVLVVLALPVMLIASWRRRRRQGQGPGRVLLGWTWTGARTALIFYALFLLLWGAGYRRERLEVRLGLERAPPRAEEVSRWVHALVTRIHRDAEPVERRHAGRALDSLRRSLAATVKAWDGVAPTLPQRVKALPPGSLLTFNSTGVVSPYFLEAHVDGASAEALRLATSAHELAHVAGFCSEADADFAAAMAGLRADDAYARYATALSLWRSFRSELTAKDPARFATTLPEIAQQDLLAADKVFERFYVASLARMQAKVYDGYLRSQGSKEGVREYARVTSLLIEAARKGIINLDEVPPETEASQEEAAGGSER